MTTDFWGGALSIAFVSEWMRNSYEYEKYIEDICPIIGADEREVVNIIFVLENNIPELPRSEEFEAILASSLAARQAERVHTDDDDDDDDNDY